MIDDQNRVLHDEPQTQALSFRPGERQVIWVLWLTYGAFYFCRTNLSTAVPGLTDNVEAGGLGFSAKQVGWILGSLKLTYGIGQLCNGFLAEHFSARRLLALGMLVSAGLNVLFGLSTGFYFLLFVWACNGYFQSLGWTPCMRVVANWIPVQRRGKSIGIIGTGYQVTQGLTYVVAGGAVELFGWRGALYVPAALLVAAAVVMLLFLRDAPTERKVSDATGDVLIHRATPARHSFVENVVITLSNPSLWFLGASLGLLNACRYGYIDWGLTHLKETQAIAVGTAALKYAVLPIGAVMGSFVCGWATDRFFGSRRAPVICILLVVLCFLGIFYDGIVRTSAAGTLMMLLAIGFCIYGPQVLLVGTAPTDLARRGTSAAAAGFVNFMGYMGAFSGDVVTGHCLEVYGWQTTLYVWSAWALAAAIAAGLLWNATAKKIEVDEVQIGPRHETTG